MKSLSINEKKYELTNEHLIFLSNAWNIKTNWYKNPLFYTFLSYLFLFLVVNETFLFFVFFNLPKYSLSFEIKAVIIILWGSVVILHNVYIFFFLKKYIVRFIISSYILQKANFSNDDLKFNKKIAYFLNSFSDYDFRKYFK